MKKQSVIKYILVLTLMLFLQTNIAFLQKYKYKYDDYDFVEQVDEIKNVGRLSKEGRAKLESIIALDLKFRSLYQDEIALFYIIEDKIVFLNAISRYFLSRDSKVYTKEEIPELVAYCKKHLRDSPELIILDEKVSNQSISTRYIEGSSRGFYTITTGNIRSNKVLYVLPEFHTHFPMQINQIDIVNDLHYNLLKQTGKRDSQILLLRESSFGSLYFDRYALSIMSDTARRKEIARGLLESRRIGWVEYMLMAEPHNYNGVGVEDTQLFKNVYDINAGTLPTENRDAMNKKRERAIFKRSFELFRDRDEKVAVLNIGSKHIFPENEVGEINFDDINPNIKDIIEKNDDIKTVVVLPSNWLNASQERRINLSLFKAFDSELLELIEQERGTNPLDIQLKFPSEMRWDDDLFLGNVNPLFNPYNYLAFENDLYYANKKELYRFKYPLLYKLNYGNAYDFNYKIFSVGYEKGRLTEDYHSNVEQINEDTKNYIFIAYKKNVMFDYKGSFYNFKMYFERKLQEENKPLPTIVEDGVLNDEDKYLIIRFDKQIAKWLQNNYQKKKSEAVKKFQVEKILPEEIPEYYTENYLQNRDHIDVEINLYDLMSELLVNTFCIADKFFGASLYKQEHLRLLLRYFKESYYLKKILVKGIGGNVLLEDTTLTIPVDYPFEKISPIAKIFVDFIENELYRLFPSKNSIERFFISEDFIAVFRNDKQINFLAYDRENYFQRINPQKDELDIILDNLVEFAEKKTILIW